MSLSTVPAPSDRPTLWLNTVGSGTAASSEELLPLIYDELRRLAAERMASEPRERTLQPTALVHEAWMRLAGGKDRAWNDRLHFFRVAARTMRRILVDRARRRSCQRHAGDKDRVHLGDLDFAAVGPDDRILMVNAAIEELKRVDPASAHLVEQRFFAGFTNREIATIAGCSERSIERQLAYAKARIIQIITDLER